MGVPAAATSSSIAHGTGICLLLVAVASFASPALAQDFDYTRQDDANAPYLEAFLSWDSGSGALTWTRGDGLDAGGPGSDVARDVWVSSPVSRDYRINGSRYIELDLFTKDLPTNRDFGTSCGYASQTLANINATLYAGDVLVADSGGAHKFALRQGTQRIAYPFPTDPDGFGVCRLRMQPQRDLLEKGTTLRLILGHATEHYNNGVKAKSFPLYGLRGDHASVLRIPFFADEEVPYRFPSYAHGPPDAGEATDLVQRVASGAGLAGLALAAAWSPFQRPPRRALALVVVLLGVMAASAGCFGNSSRSSEAGPSENGVADGSVSPVYQRGGLSKQGRGALIGQVIAGDANLPVEGAYVALLGTSNASRTDPYGRFVFKDLEPRTYRIRLDKSGYEPFEADVAVVQDLITQVNLTLIPAGSSDPGQRPHVHDYWSGQAEVTLMDRVPLGLFGTNGFPCTPAVNVCGGGSAGDVSVFLIPPVLDGFNTILPGTADVNVTVEWNPNLVDCGRFGLVWQDNHDPSFDNWTKVKPRGNGASVHIATTWEVTDPGHQRFSTWVFQIRCWDLGDASVAAGPEYVEQRLGWVERENERYQHPEQAGFNVTVKIRKGAIQFEPAHADLWRGLETKGVTEPGPVPANTSVSGALYEPVLAAGGLQNPNRHWNLAWRPTQTVPPGTTWLDVYANASRDLLPSYDLAFRYKSAQNPISAPCLQTGLSYGTEGTAGWHCEGPDYQSAGPGVTTGRSTRWMIQLAPTDADPFYVQRSFWMLGLKPDPDPVNLQKEWADAVAHGGTYPDAYADPLSFSLTVIAHRDAMPT